MIREGPARGGPRRPALARVRRSLVWGTVLGVLILGAGLVGYYSPQQARAMVRALADPILLARVERFAPDIRAAALESELDPNLIAGLVYAESSGNPAAVSSVDALGLMQLREDAVSDSAKRLGIEVPTREQLLTNPALNLRLGAAHFAWTLEHEGGELERALVAYNAGRAKLRRWIREAGGYTAWRAERAAAGNSEVLAYAARVLDYAEVFRERGRVTGGAANPSAHEIDQTP